MILRSCVNLVGDALGIVFKVKAPDGAAFIGLKYTKNRLQNLHAFPSCAKLAAYENEAKGRCTD